MFLCLYGCSWNALFFLFTHFDLGENALILFSLPWLCVVKTTGLDPALPRWATRCARDSWQASCAPRPSAVPRWVGPGVTDGSIITRCIKTHSKVVDGYPTNRYFSAVGYSYNGHIVIFSYFYNIVYLIIVPLPILISIVLYKYGQHTLRLCVEHTFRCASVLS